MKTTKFSWFHFNPCSSGGMTLFKGYYLLVQNIGWFTFGFSSPENERAVCLRPDRVARSAAGSSLGLPCCGAAAMEMQLMNEQPLMTTPAPAADVSIWNHARTWNHSGPAGIMHGFELLVNRFCSRYLIGWTANTTWRRALLQDPDWSKRTQ
jgi:hypothetical protein